jgi:hypothetical protein
MAPPPGGPARDRYTRPGRLAGGHARPGTSGRQVLKSGNQATAGGLVPAAGDGQALCFPVTVTVTGAGLGLCAMPSAGQPAAVRRQPPATGRDDYGEQAHAKRGRACPPMSQVRCAEAIWRRSL